MNEITINYKKSQAPRIFFTSDTHFYDAFIIWCCNRPFGDVLDMNKHIVDKWNAKVHKDDIVYHLGDVGSSNKNEFTGPALDKLLGKLHGRKHLIFGNHDYDGNSKFIPDYLYKNFETIKYQEVLKIGTDIVYLNHYPYLCFPGSYTDNVYQLFGHVHMLPDMKKYTGFDKEQLTHLQRHQYDVGVDLNDFEPVSWAEIKEKLK